MAEYTYPFSATSDGRCDPTVLKKTISSDPDIGTAYDHIETGDDIIHVFFSTTLSSSQIAILDAIIATSTSSVPDPTPSASVSGATPTFVASGDLLTVERYYQMLYTTPIDAEGVITTDGVLAEVL